RARARLRTLEGRARRRHDARAAARLPHRARAPAPRARSRRLPPPGRARRRVRRRLHPRAPHLRHAAPAHVLEDTLAYLSSDLAPAEPEEPVTVTRRRAARGPAPPAPRRSPTARRAASR